jgi:pimeloyl-ACP methyl ester carboxylesterase
MSERLHSVWYGNGEHVFLGIHGWGGGHGTYEPIVDYIPDSVRVLSVDLPGYGQSPALERWDPDVVAARLLATLDAEGVETCTLLGNCSGAAFGLLAAQLLPHRFERLVLIDPFAYFPWYFRLLVMPLFGPLFYWSSFGNPIGRWITNSGLAGHRTDDSDLTESFEQLDHGVVYAYLRMLKAIGSYTRFTGLSMPVDIVYGEKTFSAIRRSVSMWKEVMPQAAATELVGAGHLPIEETPEQLANAAFSPHMAEIVDLAEARANRSAMVS